jgi:hypothetical protein
LVRSITPEIVHSPVAASNRQGRADLGARKTDLVMEDQDGTLLAGEPAKRSLQLISTVDAQLRVVPRGNLERHQSKARLPAPAVPDLGVAGVDQESVEPRFEATVVAQAGQLSPCDQEFCWTASSALPASRRIRYATE